MNGWSLQRGANVHEQGVRFAVWAPNAQSLAVRVTDHAGARSHALERGEGGEFSAIVPGVGAGADYVYCIDNHRELPDPVSRYQPEGVHGPSHVVDPGFDWSDADWRGLEMSTLIFYELHVGTSTDEGTFDALIGRLGYLRDLGVTALEVMPVSQFPGARNWGYDGVFPYAPQNTYGGPQSFKGFVDAAHAHGLAVFLDVVYNHFGPEGNIFGQYGPYFTDRYKTPWGAAMNFDGPDSDEVRRLFIDNALYWVSEFHLDGLRIDAVHAIYDVGATHILEEMTDAVHALAESLGRRVHVIAESDLNDPRLVRPRETGGYGMDAQWSDDFHHAVHAALTGERNGYYSDFGGVAPIAKSMRDRFVLDGSYSSFRRRRHGTRASDRPADNFVVFIQNHDQVGNRAQGERLSALVSFRRRKLGASVLLLSPYVPLLFMGEEYGETSPFLYFVSHHDPELVEAVRDGRRGEFKGFAWGGEVPDPQAESTFRMSCLKPSLAKQPPHTEMLRLYRELIRLRKDEPALRPGGAEVRVESDDRSWVAWSFLVPGQRNLLAAANFSDHAAEFGLEVNEAVWSLLLSTEEPRFGGEASHVPQNLEAQGGAIRMVVPGDGLVLYRTESD